MDLLMNFVEVVEAATKNDLAFRRKSYTPSFVWLWFEEGENDGPVVGEQTKTKETLVIGEIHNGVRRTVGPIDLTPRAILAQDWILEPKKRKRP